MHTTDMKEFRKEKDVVLNLTPYSQKDNCLFPDTPTVLSSHSTDIYMSIYLSSQFARDVRSFHLTHKGVSGTEMSSNVE